MATEIRLPDLGESTTEGQVVSVLVKIGDTIEKDQTVIELETDKALLEVPSTTGGKITGINAKPGDTIKIDDVILTLEPVNGSAAPAAKAEGKTDRPVATPAAREVKPAPPAAPPARAATAPPPKAPEPAARVVDMAPAGNESGGPPPASPSVRKLARELGVDLGQVPGSGPGGRATKEDVRAWVRARVAGPAPSAAPGAAPLPRAAIELPDFTRWGPVERQKLSNIRKVTMERMALAWATIPSVTQVDEADITELEAVRKRHAQRAREKGGKLTATVFIMKALVQAVKEFPKFNASLDITNEELILKKYYDLGMAIDTEHGLMVPVIRDVDTKHILDLSAEIVALGERARARKLKLEELRGATITITNLGGIGGTMFSPIINPPEVAILGVARTQARVVETKDGFETRKMLPLCLTYDHRIIDGADAVRFTRKIASLLEDPALLLIES